MKKCIFGSILILTLVNTSLAKSVTPYSETITDKVTEKIIDFECNAKLSFGRETHENLYKFIIHHKNNSPLQGEYEDFMMNDGVMLKASSANIQKVDSNELKSYLKDEGIVLLMKKLKLKKKKISSLTLYTIRFDEGDEGNQASFARFDLRNKKIKVAGIIGWGMIGVCQ